MQVYTKYMDANCIILYRFDTMVESHTTQSKLMSVRQVFRSPPEGEFQEDFETVTSLLHKSRWIVGF